MERLVEICCGSFYDVKQAFLGGAKRVELNSALHLGGLTPTLAALELAKAECDLNVIAMVRPRGAGFCYGEEDFKQMLAECRQLVAHGADGIAWGCLKEDASLDMEKNKQMLDIIKEYGKEAVFHRAFDCCQDAFRAAETLIELGTDRILTSGLKPKAVEGKEMIRELQKRYGDQIQFLAGSGVNATNAKSLMDQTGINQVHSSCKDWMTDPTTASGEVSYQFAPVPHESDYDVVSRRMVEALLDSIRN